MQANDIVTLRVLNTFGEDKYVPGTVVRAGKTITTIYMEVTDRDGNQIHDTLIFSENGKYTGQYGTIYIED